MYDIRIVCEMKFPKLICGNEHIDYYYFSTQRDGFLRKTLRFYWFDVFLIASLFTAALVQRDTLLTFLTSESTNDETRKLMRKVGLKFVSYYPISRAGSHISVFSFDDILLLLKQNDKFLMEQLVEKVKILPLRPPYDDNEVTKLMSKTHEIIEGMYVCMFFPYDYESMIHFIVYLIKLSSWAHKVYYVLPWIWVRWKGRRK